MAVLALKDVSCTYAGCGTPSLKGLSLSLAPGQVLAVAGPSGSGKSTLCRLACGYFPHFFRGDLSGSALLEGMDIATTPLSDLVASAGLLFQTPRNQITGSRFTVQGEVALGPENLGLTRSETRRRVDEALSLAGAAHLALRPPLALSGGELQRVALACVLAMRPKLLVLDDPFSQLDPAGRGSVLQLIRSLADTGMAILVTSPGVEESSQAADRLLILRHGAPALFGRALEVAVDPSLPEYDVPLPRVTMAAMAARLQGLWPEGLPLPAGVGDAAAGFGRMLAGEGS